VSHNARTEFGTKTANRTYIRDQGLTITTYNLWKCASGQAAD